MTPAALGAEARVLLDEAVRTLAASGIDTARADAEWLLADLVGVGRMALRLRLDAEIPAAIADRFQSMVARRAAREPLQQILGWEAFCGLRIRVTSSVLVPRPETEALVEWALQWLPAPAPGRTARVVDVGTGSGCIACALAEARPDTRVLALDVSQAALVVARDNVGALGLGGRVQLAAADLLAAVAPGADLVVGNLPYLPEPILPALAPEVRVHEPRLALAGGEDGLALIRRLVAEVDRVLRPGGAVVLETAGEAQAVAVASMLTAAGFVAVATRQDFAGVVRLVAGRVREGSHGRTA